MFDAPVDLEKLPDFHFDHDRVITGLKKLQFNSLIRKVEKSENNAFEEHISRRGKYGATEARNDGPEGAFRESIVSDSMASALGAEPEKKWFDASVNDGIIAWDIKSIMHSDKTIAKKILAGEKFWDLSQAAFLLNPLNREQPTLTIPEEEYEAQLAELKKYPKLLNVLETLDLPLIPILYKMEKKGMLIDCAYFKSLEHEYTNEVRDLEREIWRLANREFNINSPIQLSEVLFTNLNLPTKGIKKTTRGFSTGAKELDKLKNEQK